MATFCCGTTLFSSRDRTGIIAQIAGARQTGNQHPPFCRSRSYQGKPFVVIVEPCPSSALKGRWRKLRRSIVCWSPLDLQILEPEAEASSLLWFQWTCRSTTCNGNPMRLVWFFLRALILFGRDEHEAASVIQMMRLAGLNDGRGDLRFRSSRPGRPERC